MLIPPGRPGTEPSGPLPSNTGEPGWQLWLKRHAEWLAPLVVSGLAMGVWLHQLGEVPFRDWDEGYYTVVAREMLERGDWLHPHYLDQPFLVKPPLLFWLTALGFQLGGFTESAGRWPGAFVSALAVPLTYAIARQVFQRRDTAVIAAIALITMLPAARLGRLVMMDGPSTTFLLVMLLGALLGRDRPPWRLLIGLGLGAALLCKGSLGLLFLLMVLAFSAFDRGLASLRCPWLGLGIVLGLAPVLWWFGLQVSQYGTAYLTVSFEQQISKRVASGIEGHSQPFWYYGPELLKGLFPWLLLAGLGVRQAWCQGQGRSCRLLLVPSGLYLLAISIAQTKLPWYILPLLPFVAMAAALPLARAWRGSDLPRPRFWIALWALLALVGLAAVFSLQRLPGQAGLLPAVSLVTLGFALSALFAQLARPRALVVSLLACQVLAMLALFRSHHWLWELAESFQVRPVAALLKRHVPAHATVLIAYPGGRPSLDWYCHCSVLPATPALLADVKAKAAGQPLLLLDEPNRRTWFPHAPVLGQAQGFSLVSPQPPGPAPLPRTQAQKN
ncbi:MAG: ArnT family glycosyltransferase [Synechococcaceae cyanobacterium]